MAAAIGAPGYALEAAGMAATLPYCDGFVSDKSVAAPVGVDQEIADPDKSQVVPGGRRR
jgi:hypothetical protein